MAVARDSDFLGEGTVAQPTGGTPMTLAEQAALEEKRRVLRLQQSGRNNANINLKNSGGTSTRFKENIDPKTGKPYTGDERPETASFGDKRFWKESAETIKNDPWLLALPAAPFAVAGLGAGVTGTTVGSQLGFGLGEGSLVGSSAPGMAFADSSTAGAEGVMNAARAPAAGAGTGSAPGAAAGAWTAKDTAHALMPFAGAVGEVGLQKLLEKDDSKEKRALVAKQEQLARETELRRQQTQTARMDALGQRVLAFNPYNQHMAEMFGPQAAYSPEQMAGWAQNPMKPQLDPALINYKGNDPKVLARVNEYIRQKQEYDQAEQSRHDMIAGGMQPPGPGPAPFAMPTPQPARRF